MTAIRSWIHRFVFLVVLPGLPLFPAAAVTAAATPLPDWIADPSNSQWIVFGGPEGVMERQGLDIFLGHGEGDLKSAIVGDIACGRSVRPDGKPGYFYLMAAPWEQFLAWLGENRDVVLMLRYYDGGSGTCRVRYDSSDAQVKNPPYPDGVWKIPPDVPNGIPLENSKSWKTASIPLPMARFTKGCHGADFRVECDGAEFALAGVAVMRVVAKAAPTPVVEQELHAARVEGMEFSGKGARFSGRFAQAGDEPVLMEAELATRLSMLEGHAPGLDAAASGGGYIHYVESALWNVTVKTPGRYTAWERGFFPWKGGWNHTEKMDSAGEKIIMDGTRSPEEGWQWIKAGDYDLSAGEHAFTLSYQGGARLDLVVLSRENATAPDLPALKSSYQGSVTGTVWTTEARPFDVAQWKTVAFQLCTNSASVRFETSFDHGKTWAGLNPAEPLEQFAVRGGGEDTIQFRLSFEGQPGQTPALFGGGILRYQAGPRNTRVIENSRIRMEMDPYGITQLKDKRTGLVLAKAPPIHAPIARLVMKKPGAAPITSIDCYSGSLEDFKVAKTGEDAAQMTLSYSLSNGVRMTVTAQLLPSGQIEWKLAIDNPTEWEVAEIVFPILTGCRIGDTIEDDMMFLPKCWGQVWRNPAATGHISTFWGPSMRWAAVWDAKAGLYLGIEDERLDDFGFVYGPDGSSGITLAPCQRVLVKPRSQWTSATYRHAVTGGDWHEGADVYRERVAGKLKPCETADHIKWLVDAWSGQQSNDMPTSGWDVLRKTHDDNTAMGIYLMPANRQMLDGEDSGYCGLYPYPCLAWGSVEEFRQQLAALRARGGVYTPYHNFHLWSPAYGHYQRIGSFPKSRLPADAPKPDDAWYAKAASRAYDGSYMRVETEYFAQLDMAMGSREWRQWLVDWTARYLDWGADGMYYDQFNMIYPNGQLYEDYPDTYGCWTRATLDTFSRMKNASRKINPYYTSSGEVCNDIYGQELDLHMTSGVFNRLDVYRYCNPDQILIDGSWNGGLRQSFGGYERMRFIWQVGARFEHVEGDYSSHKGMTAADMKTWAKSVLALRRAVKSLVYDARFMDTVGLTVKNGKGQILEPEYTYDGGKPPYAGVPQNAPCRGVSGRWFLFGREGQRGALINIINAISTGDEYRPTTTQKDALIIINTRDFGPVQAAMAWTFDGRCFPVAGKQEGDLYSFSAPDAELSSVVLANALRPIVSWTLDPVAAPGMSRALNLTLSNVNPDAMEGTVSLRLPKGWKAPASVRFGPIPPMGRLELAIAVTVPASAQLGRHDIRCEIQTQRGNFTTYNFMVVNHPVLAEFRGDPGGYHLWFHNLTDQAFSAEIDLQAPPPLTVRAASRVEIPPHGIVTAPVEVTERDMLREIGEMKADIRIGKTKATLRRGIMPVLPNGDFESDSAGDMKPDWWMCRKIRDEWSYERIHLAEGAHGGKYCLMLDPPQTGEQFIRAYPVNGVLKANTRYRVSAWIKAESTNGVYFHLPWAQLGNNATTPEWKQFSAEFTTGNTLADIGWFPGWFRNDSPYPAYIDDIVAEELDGEK